MKNVLRANASLKGKRGEEKVREGKNVFQTNARGANASRMSSTVFLITPFKL